MDNTVNAPILMNTMTGRKFELNSTAHRICQLYRRSTPVEEIVRTLVRESEKKAIDFSLSKAVNLFIENLRENRFSRENMRILQYRGDQPPLQLLQLDITWKCNLRCRHCYLDENRKHQEAILTLREWKSIIDEATAMEVPQIAILGGEPMLSKDFFAISKYAYEKGFRLLTTTNATLIDPVAARCFAASGYKTVDVSLDGDTKQTHEYLRGKNTFARTIKGIENLLAVGIAVKTASVVSRKNFRHIRSLLELGERLGISHMYFNSLMPGGEGKKIFENMTLSNGHWKEVLGVIAEWNLRHASTKASAEPRFVFDRISLNKYKSDNEYHIGCKAGKRELIINPEGFSVVCPLVSTDRTYFGRNIKTHSLQEIWGSDEWVLTMRGITRQTLNQSCRSCGYVDACVGGCHMASLLARDDLNAKDPRCDIV